jgi:hypothetical protein
MKIAGLDLSISSSGIIIEEIDENFEIKNIERHGFTNVKKNSILPNIVYYHKDDFRNDYERYQFFCDHIVSWCKDCEYIAVEDYAYSMSGASGLIFSLAEFEGNIKLSLFREGCKLRFYTPNQNKKFFSGRGNADKIGMRDAFNAWTGKKPDLGDLPLVTNGKAGNSPTSDIIDAFSLCEFLRKELRIRNDVESMKYQEKYIQECFLTKTKEHINGLINYDFLYK